MCDTYNCDYLKHSTLRFNLIDFQLNTDFPSQFCIFYRKILGFFVNANAIVEFEKWSIASIIRIGRSRRGVKTLFRITE